MNQKLNGIYNMLQENKNDRFVMEKFQSHLSEIEEMALTEIESRDFASAIVGLKILAALKPSDSQYKTAIERLQSRELLTAAMEKNGLPKSSLLFQQHYADLLK